MIQQKFQNIEKLKTDKAKETSDTVAVSSLNNFLLNILFNQIKVLMKFNPAY